MLDERLRAEVERHIREIGLPLQSGLRCDHRHDRKPELGGELVVALIVGGNAHDRPGAVIHQDVVGNPDRYLYPAGGIQREASGEDACLLLFGLAALGEILSGCSRPIRIHGLPSVRRRRLVDERVLGREYQEGGAEDRIGSGREHLDRVFPSGGRRWVLPDLRPEGEPEASPFRSPDPVPLSRLRGLRPVDPLQVVQQLVGVLRDAKEPLAEQPLTHRGAATLAETSDDLLVGENGLAGGAPVDRCLLLLGQPGLEELQEEPLCPPVVARVRRVDGPRPVVHQAGTPELTLEVRDVPRDELHRMDADLQRVILRVDSERIKADRLEDVLPPESAIAAIDVRSRKGV
jgi:hypothetical protein